MKASTETLLKESELQKIESYDVQHLPIIRAYLEKMEVVETIDRGLACEMEASPGRVVIGLVLDILSGRTPLYRVQEFFKHQDIELLVGDNTPLSAFCDDNIGRVLDRIFDYGTQTLFSEISIATTKAFDIDTSVVHSDTTSVSVWGEYTESKTKGGPTITHGYSKDHRPDLKQFVFSLLCVEKNIPILGRTIDGNESDKKINNTILNEIAKYMSAFKREKGAFIYVADSALITPDNLALLGDIDDPNKMPFISRLPETYNECGRVKTEAFKANQWTEIGVLTQKETCDKRPSASYKSHETIVRIDDRQYRGVVIHSNHLDKRRQKKIDRCVKNDLGKAEAVVYSNKKQSYQCEADAQAIVQRLPSFTYHYLETEVKPKAIYKRGRPPKNRKRDITKMTYVLEITIIVKKDAIERLKEEAGCFVLITTIPSESLDTKAILQTYKEQYGIEQNFGFLKDPLIVNDLFLKTPKRIEALGFILLLALLVWRLLERQMRQTISDKKIKVIGWDNKLTTTPTTFMLTTRFCSVHILLLHGKRWFSRSLTTSQQQFLDILGLDESIYLRPG